MLRALLTWGWPWWILATCSCVFGQESNREQEQAIAMIKRMGGDVAIDSTRPGKPVVQIHLFEGKTAGIGLEPLTKLPEVDWIGLHDSDISEADLACLKRWAKLKRLGLVETRLTDASLEHLRGITTPEQLYLRENAITDAGLERLAGLTNLVELDLDRTKNEISDRLCGGILHRSDSRQPGGGFENLITHRAALGRRNWSQRGDQ